MSVYKIHVTHFEELREIDGDWTAADLAGILEKLGVEDAAELNPQEVREMCVLSLQDLDPDEAAVAVLDHKLGGVLTKGQIQNVSHECQSEKLWEQGGHLELNRAMFSVGSLLAVVNERQFPTPDAVCVRLELTCRDTDAVDRLNDETAPETIVSILAAGMDDDAILNRLFADQLASGKFPEATSILWDFEVEQTGDKTATLNIISSGYWLDPLRETKTFQWTGSVAHE